MTTTRRPRASRAPVEISHYRFTVDDYYRMAEVGILCEDDRVELIDGEIIEMPPIGSPHASTVTELSSIFSRSLRPDQAVVWSQNPVRLNDATEPVPDVVLLSPREDKYRSGHPGPADVLLLIEVSDSTYAFDTQIKLPRYAQAGVTEVWIVDLQGEAVEVYRQPSGGTYASRSVVKRGRSVSPSAFSEVMLTLDEILGPPPAK